ncbi:hypothetical protein J2X06_002600 [Lysobacter niastensis]|uniref:Outer membrane protein beta-barrel domain-containing protein n=1 Tax=Lysobacter niastensis TaxID=380629 RepID=A0ABU1WD40_9GAMM|nr:hypothetical protein [Lysobacter niastensis]MDR7135391.1 hypothetical protein [Lysobacter niastensis]
MKKQLALAATLVTAPFAASAGALSYTYVEAGYAHLAQDDIRSFGYSRFVLATPGDVKSDGFFVGGSAAIGESFYGFANYRRGSDTVEVQAIDYMFNQASFTYEADVTTSRLNVGIGYHYGLSESTDLLAEVSLLNSTLDIEGAGRDDYDDGIDPRVSFGARSALTDAIEIWGKGHYTDGDFYQSEVSGSVGMQVRFNQTFGITGEFEAGSDYSQYTLGLRASF